MNYAQSKNIGQYVSAYVVPSSDVQTETTTETHSTQSSNWVDLVNDVDGHFQSVKVIVPVHATLPVTAAVTVSANLQDATSSSGAGAADLGSTANFSTALGSSASTAAQNIDHAFTFDVNLTTANQFIRSQVSLSFSTDTTAATHQVDQFDTVFLFAGAEVLPST